MEHNSMSIDLAAQISVAAQDVGITPVVRVPAFEHFHATRALDAGAQGIVVPHVDTADVAARIGAAFERIVAACRAHGKHAGLGGVYDPALMQRYLAMGFRLVLAGSDLTFMLAAAKERAAAVRAMNPA
jgi:2-keto-3-deoxy-L-rhamnonate aldolase RhmA